MKRKHFGSSTIWQRIPFHCPLGARPRQEPRPMTTARQCVWLLKLPLSPLEFFGACYLWHVQAYDTIYERLKRVRIKHDLLVCRRQVCIHHDSESVPVWGGFAPQLLAHLSSLLHASHDSLHSQLLFSRFCKWASNIAFQLFCTVIDSSHHSIDLYWINQCKYTWSL